MQAMTYGLTKYCKHFENLSILGVLGHLSVICYHKYDFQHIWYDLLSQISFSTHLVKFFFF